MERFEVYTDGSYSLTTKVGAWAFVAVQSSQIIAEHCGTADFTSSQAMELSAAIEALQFIKDPSHIKIFSDSSYLVESFNAGWVYDWESEGFLLVGGKERKNSNLFKQLIELTNHHNVTFIKVKGHSRNFSIETALNNRVDGLAGEARKGYERELGIKYRPK